MRIVHWVFEHLLNEHFWRKIKIVCQSRPWDFWGLYALEKESIAELWDYIQCEDRYYGVEYDVRDMKIAERLLEIMMDDTQFFHFETPEYQDGLDNNGNEVRFPLYVCDVKVNLRNIDRFVKDPVLKRYYMSHPHELYIEKARCLYHKIRLERDLNWSS